jgi:glycosyltransferase involved in cell wall biosynthesis
LVLASIRNQTHKDTEVIVVDRSTNDGTRECVEGNGYKYIAIESERSKAKNLGTKLARGKYVLFLDSDMDLEPNVVEDCVNLCENQSTVGYVTIPESSTGSGFWAKVRAFERSFYAGTTLESARFFRRSVVERVQGFDENIVFYEESTLQQRIEDLHEWIGGRANSRILHNESDFELGNWLRKKFYYGTTARSYIDRYAFGCQQSSLVYRLRIFAAQIPVLLEQPRLSLGLLVLKLLELVAFWLGLEKGTRTGQDVAKSETRW